MAMRSNVPSEDRVALTLRIAWTANVRNGSKADTSSGAKMDAYWKTQLERALTPECSALHF